MNVLENNNHYPRRNFNRQRLHTRSHTPHFESQKQRFRNRLATRK